LWLHEARIRGVDTLRQEQRPPGPGEQGPELLALLSVVLSGPAIIELVRSIHRWIEASRPTVTITIKSGERTVSIDSRNPKRLEELVAAAERLSGD
jgi:hypothetical protein